MARTAPPVAAAIALSLLLGFLGTRGIAFTDYEVEAENAATALAAGRLEEFARLAPAYGGSLILRAPFAWASAALGWPSDLGLYRALVLPALLAAGALGVVLWRAARDADRRGAWMALALVAANPFAMRAFDKGHPEEVVGAVLCVAALLVALRGHALVAGVLVGLAVANKPWALVAVLPVLLALEHHRVRAALGAAAVCGAVLGPLLLAGSAVQSVGAVARNASTIFQPHQVFWFFGEHEGPVARAVGVRIDYRSSVDWAQAISHPTVVLVAAALALAWWRRGDRSTALALLALVLLTRCLLDTWNTDYYGVPFLFALAAHEVIARGRAPWATLIVTVGFWTTMQLLPTPDVQTVAYLLFAGATWGLLALATFAPARAAALTRRAQRAAAVQLPSLVAQPVSAATAASRSPGATA